MSRPPRKRIFWITCAGLISALAALGWIIADRSPRRNLNLASQPLAEILLTAYSPAPNTHPAEINAARDLVIEAGTNCVPILRRWLREEVSTWRKRIGLRLFAKGIESSAFPTKDFQYLAFRAIQDLGRDALPLTVDLAASCTNANAFLANEAARTLEIQFTKLEEFPISMRGPLIAALNESLAVLEQKAAHDSSFRYPGVRLKRLRDSAGLILDVESLSEEERAKALRLLSRRDQLYERALPYLLNHLVSTNSAIAENAAICLRNYGAKAANTLPDLEKALSHPNERVRAEAAQAIQRISVLANETVPAF